MRVDAAGTQAETLRNVYAASSSGKTAGAKEAGKSSVGTKTDTIDERLKSLMEQSAEKVDSGSNQTMKSSSQSDSSVGQLAAELARAETQIDVQLVNGKAMRAMANLKASLAMASDEDKEKISKQIRRMEKLMKNIQKKLKLLGKEERLEERRKLALKKQETQKAEELRKELQSRRKKRRREERRYAREELAQDARESTQEMLASIGGAGAVPTSPTSVGDMLSGMGGYGGAAPAVEGASVDVSV